MKNIFKILSCVTLSVLIFASCNVENIKETYTPIQANEVSFSQAVISSSAIEAKQTTFEITLSRNTSASAITVPLKATLPEGITAPESVSFGQGEYTSTLTLDISAMKIGTVYKGKIALTDTTTFNSKIATASTSFTLAKAYTWTSIGKGQWFDAVALSTKASLCIQSVDIQQAEGFDRYRIMNPYPKEAVINSWGEDYYGGEVSEYIEFWINEDKTIRWKGPLMPGVIYVDLGANAYVRGYYPLEYSEDQVKEAANCKMINDKVGQFYAAYVIENSKSWFGYNPCYVSLPGGPDLNELLK
jgi:hypothetical protein